jgi:hypothetical protein
MDNARTEVREEFIRIVDGLVVRLRDPAAGADGEGGHPAHMANLGHRLSDTLPSDLAEQLEELVDDLLTLCGEVWPDRVGGAVDPDPGAEVSERLDHVGRRWSRFKRHLFTD